MITEAGELLLRRGLITAQQLVQSRANLNGNGILESIIESGFAREEDALKAIAEEFGLDYIDLRETNVDLSLLATFPQKLIYRHSLF
ncbi:MAG: type II/IV secretion system protein, partial [bacterium]